VLLPVCLRRYVLPAVEDVCRAHGSAAGRDASASSSGDAASVPPRALVLKHCLRDEYDDLTDIARLYRIKARFQRRLEQAISARCALRWRIWLTQPPIPPLPRRLRLRLRAWWAARWLIRGAGATRRVCMQPSSALGARGAAQTTDDVMPRHVLDRLSVGSASVRVFACLQQ
jgi:hypothetical protein